MTFDPFQPLRIIKRDLRKTVQPDSVDVPRGKSSLNVDHREEVP